MAEYIEREAVLKIIADNCPHDKCGYNTEEEMGAGAACYYIMKDVGNIPTADVVPKSEVDKWKQKAEELSEVLSDTIRIRYSEAKVEVAREIIKDLVKFADDKERHFHGHGVWYIDADDVTDFIAELKKKYTESEGEHGRDSNIQPSS